MKKGIIILLSFIASYAFYACKKDDTGGVITNPTPTNTLLASTLTAQTVSGSTASGSGTFSGNLNNTTRIMSYTVTYSGVNPTAITLDPVTNNSPTNFTRSILLAGNFPSSITTPGSGTSTTPGSGTSTTPGSGTSTTPGSGTTTTPGSGTSTTPGSGTSTTPGSGTSTTPGSGTSTTPGSGTTTTPGTGTSTTPGSTTLVTISSPLTGTTTLTQSRADSISRGLYTINIRTAAFPTGAVGGVIMKR